MNKKPIARNENLVIQDAEKEMLIYDLETNEAICLNPTAKFIWENCDGERDIDEILELTSQELGLDIDNRFIQMGLRELEESNLLVEGSFINDLNSKITRRDLIAKKGIPLIALPLVMSLVAPLQIQAQSCIPIGSPCVPNPAIPNDGCCQNTGLNEICNGGICTE